VIDAFNPLEARNDHGAHWENFLESERIKYQAYRSLYGSNYFWRTYDGQEIDWIEERDGQLSAYEFKWGKKQSKTPPAFAAAYTQHQFEVITKDNYLDFIT